MDLYELTLPNGIRMVHLPVASRVAHCGLFIHAGSREETDREHGIAHFIEHTIFKGTERRSVFQVLNRLENVGADLNAFTTKEETVIHASFLREYYDRTLELFQDLFFNAVFPERELEREKQVVMDEIRSYRDMPDEQIFDDFEDLVFAGHPLGRNVLGTEKSVRKFRREDILGFIHRNYRLGEVVIASAGEIDFKKFSGMVARHFSRFPDRGESHPRIPCSGYQPFRVNRRKRTAQVHCIIGGPAYPFGHENQVAMGLFTNLLGGPVMNSRLALALRERKGLTYHNEAFYAAYSDAGIAGIYFGTDPGRYEEALDVAGRELKLLREKHLSPIQLHTAKKQIAGQLALSRESNLSMMLAIGKSYLLHNRFDPPDVITRRIDAVTSVQLAEIANEVFGESATGMLTYRG